MEDKSLFSSSQPQSISEGLQNFINTMVEEIVLEGKPFDTQKKYLKKFSENEGLDYEKLEADITTFIEILDSLKVAFTKVQVKLAEEKGKECHISDETVKKLVSYSQKNLPKKEKKNKTGLWIGLCLAAAMVTALVVLLVRPKHTPADPDTQAYEACQTVADYRAYMRSYGTKALHYAEAKAFVDQYLADSIEKARQAQALVDAEQKAEAERQAQAEAEKKRQIGDLVEFDDGDKGVVFYVDNTGEHGLVVSLDEGHGAFCNLPIGTELPDELFVDDESQSIVPGKGKLFTTNLIKAFGSNAIAAKWARNHGDKWYLPSNGEMFYLLRTANKRSGPQGPVSIGLSKVGGTTISTKRHGGYLSSSIRKDGETKADLSGFDEDACNYCRWMWYAEGAYRAVRQF